MKRRPPIFPLRTAALGFTLIELMVTIALLAILTSLAVPAMQTFIVRNNMSGLANDLTASVLQARHEAMTRNACVTMCRSTSVSAAAPRCNEGADDNDGKNWNVGWIVFRNPTCDFSIVTPDVGLLIRTREAGPADYFAIKDDADEETMNFNGSGQLRDGKVNFSIESDKRDPDRTHSRALCVDSLGRVRVAQWGGTC